MKITPSKIPGVEIIEPEVIADERGFFIESFNQRAYADEAGIDFQFVQDNLSQSGKGVLRGLHYQIKQAQGKLIRVVSGEVFDVAVDIRKDSTTFGQWVGFHLSAENKKQTWIPPGFAHGFLVLSESADVLYKTTEYYEPDHQRCILWNDPEIGIEWPIDGDPILSEKDKTGKKLLEAEVFTY